MSRCVEEIQQLDWRGFKAVLFDVDGTLYDQPMLRRKMAIELGLHYAFRPHRFREIKILSRFRHMREEYFEREEENLAEAQYDWAAKDLGISSDQVRTVIEEWIYSRPLKHLPECRPPRTQGIVCAVAEQRRENRRLLRLPAAGKTGRA